jgi:uncharacterized protein YggE
MSKIDAWQIVAAAAALAGLGIGVLVGNRSEPGVRTATLAPASALATGAGGPPTAGITVTGSGTVSGTPDALKLAMGIQATRPNVTAALDDANAAATKVQASLKRHGVPEKDLQTSGLSIQAQYNYDNNKQTLTGYLVSENLTATLRDLKTAGATISAATSSGGDASRVDSVTLDLTDTSSLVSKAREAAFKQAKDKATQYARVAGVSLRDVVSISETTTTAPPLRAEAGKVPMDSVAASSPVPIQPGSQDVVVEVTVVFGIG